MNKGIRATGWALTGLLVSMAAQGQTQVQINGRIDLALRHLDDGRASTNYLQREGARSSRLGFRATEDLGNGLRAGITLETQLRADNGAAPNPFWERQSLVWLRGPWGEVRLGRDFALQNSIGGDFDALNGKGVGNMMNLATPFNFSNTNTYTRVNNAVSYITPQFKGFSSQLQLAPGEQTSGNRHTAFALSYVDGPAEARVTQGRTDVNSIARVNPLTGASTKQAARGDFIYSSLGLAYDFKTVKLLGSVLAWRSATEVATGERRSQRNVNFGAMVPVGSSGSINVAYTRADRSGMGSDNQDASQIGVQYLHRLSKRTSLYASWAQIKQSALAAADPSSDGARYNMDGPSVLGRKAQGVDIGLVHAF